jgi:hypothetical protein
MYRHASAVAHSKKTRLVVAVLAMLSMFPFVLGRAHAASTVLSVGPPYSACNASPRTQPCTSATHNSAPLSGRVVDLQSGRMAVTNLALVTGTVSTTPAEIQIRYSPISGSATSISVAGDFSFTTAGGASPAVSVSFCTYRSGAAACTAPTATKLLQLQQAGPQDPRVPPAHVVAVRSGSFPSGTVVRAWFRVHPTTRGDKLDWVVANLDRTQVSAVATPAATTAIVSGPAVTSAETTSGAPNSAAFAFASRSPVAGFRCGVDSVALYECSSPFNVGQRLSNGQHIFYVQPVDAYGRRLGPVVSQAWTVAR